MSSDSTAPADAGSTSASALLSTLIPSFAVAAIAFSAFLLFRQRYKRVYEPRAHVDFLRDEQKSTAPGPGWENLRQAVCWRPDTDVLYHQSLDAYLFLRYLKICTVICFVGCIITWPILFPTNATGHAPHVVQLDILSMAKIENKNRYYAQALVAWIFFGFVIFVITRESIYFINLRTAHLLSGATSERMSPRTVLFTYIPQAFQDKEKLFDFFDGEVREVWIVDNCEELTDLVEDRYKTALKLEKAEINLCQTGYGKYLEAEKKTAKAAKKAGNTTPAAEPIAGAIIGSKLPVAGAPQVSATDNTDIETDTPQETAYSKWIEAKDRPTHRLKFLIGKKVDTINWCQEHLVKKIPEISEVQHQHQLGLGTHVNSAFVEFRTLEAAQNAIQRSYKGSDLSGVVPFIGLQPSEVIWKNLTLSRTSRRLRTLAATAFIILLIIFWAIPVAVVGAISNINFLTNKVPFLHFIDDIPSVILGVVTGLLPVVALSILMSLVPVFCKMLAKASGVVSTVHVELWCQQWYYAFNVIQVFLVVTIASAATTVVTKIINDPSSATSLLANNLPGASNFYISYFILQGLSIASMGLLQIGGLAGFVVLSRFLDKTPRKLYHRWITLASNSWGALYPKFSLLCMIAIVYSCIAPLVLGFATIGIFLMYLGFKYNFLFVFTTVVSTNGAAYPRALQHLMVGVYLGEICLLGLFGIKATTGPLVLMGIFTIVTVIYHILLNRAIDPLLKFVPLNIFEQRQNQNKTPKITVTVPVADQSDDALTPLPPGSIKFLYKLFCIDPTLKHSLPVGSGNFLSRYIYVNTYASPNQLAALMPLHMFGDAYDVQIVDEAYFNPVVTSPVPIIWIAKDPLGISSEEISKTNGIIAMTDQGALIDEKNKVVWDTENAPDPVIKRPNIVY